MLKMMIFSVVQISIYQLNTTVSLQHNRLNLDVPILGLFLHGFIFVEIVS